MNLGGIVVKKVHSLEDAIQDFVGFKATLFVLFRSWDMIVHFLSCINLLLNPKNSKLYPLTYILRMTIHKLVSKLCLTTALSSHRSWVISTIFQRRRSSFKVHGVFLQILAIFRMIWQYMVQLHCFDDFCVIISQEPSCFDDFLAEEQEGETPSPWHFLEHFGDFLHLLHQLVHTWFRRIWDG